MIPGISFRKIGIEYEGENVMAKISLIIPYQPDHGRRDFVWSFVYERYQRLMPEVELCIAGDDSKLFSKAKAVNRAAKQATGDIFVIADAEVVFHPGLLDRILSEIHRHPWIIPYTEVYRLTQEASDRLIEEGLPEEIVVEETDIQSKQWVLGGYMNAMPRSVFEKVGGMDERFEGYGYEDVAFAWSLDTLCGKHYRMEETIYHLWHPWADIYHENFRNNYDLYLRYKKAEGDVEAMQRLIAERH